MLRAAVLHVYARFLAGELPAGVAAMQALAGSHSAEEARLALPAEAGPVLAPLLTEQAHALVNGMLALADHEAPTSPEGWASVFDRAAALSPEASVALYSLGDPDRLDAATQEVADWLQSEALVGAGLRVLEIGCGIGRFVSALAPSVELFVGLDVSAAMCAEAAGRTAGLAHSGVVRTGGRDLAAFADEAFDVVLAVDSFPYLVNAGLEEAMVAEAARVLRPGGRLVVLNWSYRGDPELDRFEADTFAGQNGLARVDRPTPSLAHWDGAVHHMVKPC